MGNRKMLNRLFAVMFIFVLFGGPVISAFFVAGSASLPIGALQKKSMCLSTGVGCGSGHVIIPALVRM